MKKILITMLTATLWAPSVFGEDGITSEKTLDIEVTRGKRWAEIYTGGNTLGHQMMETNIAPHFLFQLPDLTVALGPVVSFQQYRQEDFVGTDRLRGDGVNTEYGLESKLYFSVGNRVKLFGKLRHVVMSAGERTVVAPETDTGYDRRGREKFSTTGSQIGVGGTMEITEFLELMVEVDYSSKTIKFKDRDFQEHQVSLTGGPDQLSLVNDEETGGKSYNSTGVLVGVRAVL